MSNWKKIIVSGSNTHLSSVTASNGSIVSGSLTMSGSITNVEYVDFNTTPAQSIIATVDGRLSWDDGARTLVVGAGNTVDYHVAQQEFAYVVNTEATTLAKGEVVYVSGSQGNTIAVKRADNSGDSLSAGTLGLVAESIASGAEGLVLVNGLMRKLDTSTLTAGKLLFLGSTPGTYTETIPTAPSHSVRIGYVAKVDALQGEIYVKIDNGYEIGELHDIVDGTTSTSYGDLLVKSGSVWKNSKQLTGSYGLTGSFQATSFTGSLQGTATTASYVLNAVSSSFATTASYVQNVPSPTTMNITDDNTNAVYYPVFVDGAGSGKTLYADTTTTPTSINPNTGEFKLSNTVKIQSNANGNRIAVGHNAGQTSHGTSSIAMGYFAGNISQGDTSIAIGYTTGETSQGTNAVAIGTQAGKTSQGTGSTAVGYQTGVSSQGNYSVAIGYQTGFSSQGANSVAIGRNAGYSNQPANTIIINASSNILNGVASQTSSFYVDPIRSSSYTSGALYYNPTTKEITSLLAGTETTATSASFATTASYVRNSVSSSFATTASYVLNSVSSSFATTASYATIVEFPQNQISNVTSTTTFFVNTDISQNPSSNRNVSYPELLTDIAGTNLTSDGDSINLNTAITGLTSITSTSFTGSLQGTATTASYVLNAISSSFTTNATSASFASTASYINTLRQDVTVSGSVFLSGSLNTPVLIDYEERFTSPTISAGTLTLNLANGNIFDVALNAAITTLTISSPPASNNAGSFVLIFTADGTARSVTWGASVLWPGGIAPTLTSTNGKKDVFGFISLNSGTNWYGFIGGQNI